LPTSVFEVAEVRGKCSVHKVGEEIVVEGPRIDLERTDNLCIHTLPQLPHLGEFPSRRE
jgi:uncharacterized repeat protein (TIGR04076 family)